MKRPFGRGTTLLKELSNGGYQPLTNWDDDPSTLLNPLFVHYRFVFDTLLHSQTNLQLQNPLLIAKMLFIPNEKLPIWYGEETLFACNAIENCRRSEASAWWNSVNLNSQKRNKNLDIWGNVHLIGYINLHHLGWFIMVNVGNKSHTSGQIIIIYNYQTWI